MRDSQFFSRGTAKYQRGKSSPSNKGKTFLIVTEGEKTEPNYLNAIKDRLRLSTIDVQIIHPSQTDPLSLTKSAIALRDKRKKEIAKGSDKVPYDEVWVVFDLETLDSAHRQKANEAKKLTAINTINFAVSDPSFEYWLLLHEEYTTAPFQDAAQVEQYLKSKTSLKNYSKGKWLPSTEFLDKTPIAVKNAGKCRAYHKSSNSINPMTTVDNLICCLNNSTRQHYQFNLPISSYL